MTTITLHYFETGKLLNEQGFAVDDWGITAQTSGLEKSIRARAYRAANIGNIDANKDFIGQYGFFKIEGSNIYVFSYQCLSDTRETGRSHIHQGKYVLFTEKNLRQLGGFIFPIADSINNKIPIRSNYVPDLPHLRVMIPKELMPKHFLEIERIEVLLPKLLEDGKVYLSNLPAELYSRLEIIEQIRSLVPYSYRRFLTFTTSVISPRKCSAHIQMVDDSTATMTAATDIFGHRFPDAKQDGQTYSSWIVREYRRQSQDFSNTLTQIDRSGIATSLPAGRNLDQFSQARIGWEDFIERSQADSLLSENCYIALREYTNYLSENELDYLFSVVIHQIKPSNELYSSIITGLLLTNSNYVTRELVSKILSGLSSLLLQSESSTQSVSIGVLVNTFVNGFLDNPQVFSQDITTQGIGVIFYHLLEAKSESLIIVALYALLGNPRVKVPLATGLLQHVFECFDDANLSSKAHAVCIIVEELGTHTLYQLLSKGSGLYWVNRDLQQMFAAINLIFSSKPSDRFPQPSKVQGFALAFSWQKTLILSALRHQKPYLITSEQMEFLVSAQDWPQYLKEIIEVATENEHSYLGFSPKVARYIFMIAVHSTEARYLKFAGLLFMRMAGSHKSTNLQSMVKLYYQQAFLCDEPVVLLQWVDQKSVFAKIPMNIRRDSVIDAVNFVIRNGNNQHSARAILKDIRKARCSFEYDTIKEAFD